MAALLDEIATGQPVQVPLVDGQSGRGPRVAISQAATRRGLTVETVKWEGFVAVRKLDEPADPEGEVDGCDRRTTTTGPATPA